jgi:hypothetical protein
MTQEVSREELILRLAALLDCIDKLMRGGLNMDGYMKAREIADLGIPFVPGSPGGRANADRI